MVRIICLPLFFFAVACLPVIAQHASLETQSWIHGSESCSENRDSPLQVVRYNDDTWILRQNKCIHYEAPFLFLFKGNTRALLIDTGATGEEKTFPLYSTVRQLLDSTEAKGEHSLPLIVAHSHNHADHRAGDRQFAGKPEVTLVGLETADVAQFFACKDWPNEMGTFDLGNRVLDIIPIPGHEKSSIALYDRSTQLLLTGDTFYPGRLYVDDWAAYKTSIARLVQFTSTNPVLYILGNHIEMSITPGDDYPIGSTFHPREQVLPLGVQDLLSLQAALNNLGHTPTKEVHDKFIIFPK